VSISAQQGRHDIVIRFSAPFEPVTFQLTDIEVSGRTIVNYRQLDDRSIAIAVDQPLAVGTMVTVAPAPHQIRLVGNLGVPMTTVQVVPDSSMPYISSVSKGPADAVVLHFSELPQLTPDFTLLNLSAGEVLVQQGSAQTTPFLESGADCDLLERICWFHVRSTPVAAGNTIYVAPGSFTDGAGNRSLGVAFPVLDDNIGPASTSGELFKRQEFLNVADGISIFGPFGSIGGSPIKVSLAISGPSDRVTISVKNGRDVELSAGSAATWLDIQSALGLSPARDLIFISPNVSSRMPAPFNVTVSAEFVLDVARLCFNELVDLATVSAQGLPVDLDGDPTTAVVYEALPAFYEAPVGFDRCLDLSWATDDRSLSMTNFSRVLPSLITDVAGNLSVTSDVALSLPDGASPSLVMAELSAMSGTTLMSGSVLSRLGRTADTVVIVRPGSSESFAAPSIAGAFDAVILGVDGVWSSDALAALDHIMDPTVPRRAIIVGGNATVPASIESQLVARGISVSRVTGSNRFQTAANVATEIRAATGASRYSWAHDIVAIGAFDRPDEMAAVAGWALAHRIPLLGTTSATIPAETANYLVSNSIRQVLLVGTQPSMDPTMVDQFLQLGVSVLDARQSSFPI
jgi:hypothetical protein